MISFLCGISNMTQMNLCTQQKEAHRPSKHTGSCWEKGEPGGGIGTGLGVRD